MDGIRKLPLEDFPLLNLSTTKLIEQSTDAAEAYRAFLLSRSWDHLHAHIIPLRGLANMVVDRIKMRTQLQDHWSEYLSDQDSALKNKFEMLNSDDSNEAKSARSLLITELTKALDNKEEANKTFDQLMSGDHALFTSRAMQKTAVRYEQDLLVTTYMLLTSIAHRALIDTSIFISYDKVKDLKTGPEGDGDTKIIQNETTELAKLHEIIVAELFDTLNSNTEIQTYVSLCVGHQTVISGLLSSSSMLLGGYLALLIGNTPSVDITNQLRAVLKLIEQVKRLSMIHAYLSLVQADSATLDPGRWYSAEQKRATSRQRETEVPSGQSTTLEAILSGDFTEGDFVQIEGLVKDLVIDDDPSPPKFSSFFNLAATSSESTIRIRAHMFSLANNGLSDDSFVQLSGFIRTNPAWNDAVGIDIDRVSLTELRKTSWYDDITHRVRHSNRLFQDGMNIFFTPAVEGA